MKKYYCLDCKKEISDYRRKRCRSCNGVFLYKEGKLKVGKFDTDYNDGISLKKPSCLECHKKLSDYRVSLCKSCSTKNSYKNGKLNNTGDKHYAWKGGLPKCFDCGKQLSNYGNKRCYSCENKRKHKLSIINAHTSNYKHGKTLMKAKCIDCGEKLGKLAVYFNTKRCRSCAMIDNIKKGKYTVLPNKPEKIIRRLLRDLFPRHYKYVGNGIVWIKNYNPDFIDIKNKKIVEHFGDYWHNIPKAIKKDKSRLSAYKKAGYKTLVIWEHELKSIKRVINKLIKFNS